MRRVIVLRPEPGASETMDRARALGLPTVSIPLFEIEPLQWVAPPAADFDALLMTSANAVREAEGSFGALRELPVYAVGSATAAAARNAGLRIAASGDRGVDRLLSSIDPELRLLHLCGEHRTSPSSSDRSAITPVPVYRSRALEEPDLGAVPGGIVLVHSPRAGGRLGELVADRSTSAIVAISDSAAAAVGSGWERIDVADRPSDEALLALAARLCNKTAA